MEERAWWVMIGPVPVLVDKTVARKYTCTSSEFGPIMRTPFTQLKIEGEVDEGELQTKGE